MVEGFNAKLSGAGVANYEGIKGADVCIVTAGVPRKPGMSRDDLLGINLKVMESVGAGIKQYAPTPSSSVSPIRSTPWSGHCRSSPACPPTRSSAWPASSTAPACACFLAEKAGVSIEDVRAMTLGGHGDDMVPMTRYSTIGGVPLPDCIKLGMFSQAELDAMIQHCAVAAARS